MPLYMKNNIRSLIFIKDPEHNKMDFSAEEFTTLRRMLEDGIFQPYNMQSDTAAFAKLIKLFPSDSGSLGLPIVHRIFKSYMASQKSPDKTHYRIETGRWVTGKKKDELGNEKFKLISKSESLLTAFIGIVETEYVPSPKVSGLPVATVKKKDDDDVPVESDFERREETLKVARKPMSAALRVAVWNEEQARTDGLKWRGENMSDAHTRLCFSCLNRISFPDVDVAHIVPASRSGTDTVPNLRVACSNCNKGRAGMSNFHAYEYMIRTNKAGLKFANKHDPNVTVGWTLYELDTMLHAYLDKVKTPVDMYSQKDDLVDRLNRFFDIISAILNVPRGALPPDFRK